MKPALNEALIRWYRVSKRDLPWRKTTDPYAIWLSEIMLQQTRVDTVIPYFQRFLQEFPTVFDLAAAPEEKVLQRWAGLGYYTRARKLHAAAKVVAERGGSFPDNTSELEELPGIGRYTAGAIASIAFGKPASLVDGNVARVLARLLGLDCAVDAPAGMKEIWRHADGLVAAEAPSDWNQGLMELGATVCLPPPKSARCSDCPLKEVCVAHRKGAVDELPKRSPRRKAKPITRVGLLVRAGSKLLVAQCPAEGLFGGLWEIPSATLKERSAKAEALQLASTLIKSSAVKSGEEIQIGERTEAKTVHQLTHLTITWRIFEWENAPFQAQSGVAAPSGYQKVAWIAQRGDRTKPLSTAMARVLECVTATRPTRKKSEM